MSIIPPVPNRLPFATKEVAFKASINFLNSLVAEMHSHGERLRVVGMEGQGEIIHGFAHKLREEVFQILKCEAEFPND